MKRFQRNAVTAVTVGVVFLLAGCAPQSTDSNTGSDSPSTTGNPATPLSPTPILLSASAIGDMAFRTTETQLLPYLTNLMGEPADIISGVDYCEAQRMPGAPLPANGSMTYVWPSLTVMFRPDAAGDFNAPRYLVGWAMPLPPPATSPFAVGNLPTAVTFDQLATLYPTGTPGQDGPGSWVNYKAFQRFTLTNGIGYWGIDTPQYVASSELVC